MDVELLWENLKRRILGRPSGINLREVGWGCGLDSSGLGKEPVAGCCECANEIKVRQARDVLAIQVQLRMRWVARVVVWV